MCSMHILYLRNWHSYVFHSSECIREISKNEDKPPIKFDLLVTGHHEDNHNMLRGCRSRGVSNCLCDNVGLRTQVPDHIILHW
jgi:hypothetical protein